MASIPRDEYYRYRDMVKMICDRGDKDALEKPYMAFKPEFFDLLTFFKGKHLQGH